jgi:hypothetical protein
MESFGFFATRPFQKTTPASTKSVGGIQNGMQHICLHIMCMFKASSVRALSKSRFFTAEAHVEDPCLLPDGK